VGVVVDRDLWQKKGVAVCTPSSEALIPAMNASRPWSSTRGSACGLGRGPASMMTTASS
jgi:hypothetical protein